MNFRLFPTIDGKLSPKIHPNVLFLQEAKPIGLFAKLKYYLKRYWYIAIPIHIASCVMWFILLYIAVKRLFSPLVKRWKTKTSY